MLRAQIGLANSVYYLSHLVGDFVFYSILCVPSIIMVSLGFRQEELSYLSQGWHVSIEVVSKISFGLILLPVVYLLGFFQRKNASAIYKTMGLFLYLIGHFFTMSVLAIVAYQT